MITVEQLTAAGLRLCGCREVMPVALYDPDGKRAGVDRGQCRLCKGRFGRKPF